MDESCIDGGNNQPPPPPPPPAQPPLGKFPDPPLYDLVTGLPSPPQPGYRAASDDGGGGGGDPLLSQSSPPRPPRYTSILNVCEEAIMRPSRKCKLRLFVISPLVLFSLGLFTQQQRQTLL